MKITQMFSVTGMLLLLGGCATAPSYTRPVPPVPADLPGGAAYTDAQPGQGVLAAADIRWQAVFPDEKLQKIIGISLANNRDLKLAALNVERARAYYG
ncbi:MAG: multidrug transporter, partial [Clostridia bacterium]|nr:multidrug transporter [Clostridia bacterium]